MKTHLLFAAAVLLVATSAAPAHAGNGIQSGLKGKQSLKFERNARNQFEWLSEAPGEKIRGSAPGVTGTVTVDPAVLGCSSDAHAISSISGFYIHGARAF